MNSKWFVYAKKADFQAIAKSYGIDQLTARVLRNRDICSAEDIDLFLNGGIADLYDSGLLPDIDRAIAVICEVLTQGGKIRIVGDYDIDGVCSTYILLKGLQKLHARVDARIPDRIKDGYGINRRIVEEAISDRVDLIITCDNGIAAIDELKTAKENGIRVVVTDHHNVRTDETGREVVPDADAVVDVKLADSKYPTQEICGAVIAWKVIRELYRACGLDERAWLQFLEFAALATIGDIMPLVGENRIIVREGLKVLNHGRHPAADNQYGTLNLGMKIFIRCLGLEYKAIDTYHVGFILGPCINAGGRLESADTALALFMSEDQDEAEVLAGHLMKLNEERKNMTEKGVEAGMSLIEEQFQDDKVLVVYIPELHESLAGIVAGRIKENVYKPTIVLTKGKDGLKGSGRSIESYDMFAALVKASGHLQKYGGHRQAAGLSLSEDNLAAFRSQLNLEAGLSEEDFIRKIWIDAALPFGYINASLIEELNSLAPFGNGMERPTFAGKGIRVTDLKVIGKLRNALKMKLTDEQGISLEGIAFGKADEMAEELKEADTISVLYHLGLNEFNGRRTVQLEIKEYRVS